MNGIPSDRQLIRNVDFPYQSPANATALLFRYDRRDIDLDQHALNR